LLAKVAIAAVVGSLISPHPTRAQTLPPTKEAVNVEITQQPTLELAVDDFAIIRWTTTNPGGSDDHIGVVHYGLDRKELSQTVTSHIKLNRGHPETIFRVRLNGLAPRTTYYYSVSSMGSDGESDGVESSVNRFTTPGPGERIVAYPQPR
jgi:Purple acid Phosphatase, N-terminal domain